MIQRIKVCSWFSVVKKDQRNSLPFRPSLMSFFTQGLPAVAESAAAICEEQPTPWGEDARQSEWGVGERSLPRPSLTVCGAPLSRRVRVNFWMMDSMTSLFGSAQNDRGGGILRRMKVFGLNKPTKRKSGAMCMSWSLMQCVMIYDWYWVHWFLIETCI